MSRVHYVRRLAAEDAGAIARIEKQLYPRSQRNGRRSIAVDLHNADFDNCNLSAGLFDGATLVGYLIAYLTEDRRSIFDEFEVDHDDAATLSGASVYIEDFAILPSHARRVYFLVSKWERELRRRAPLLPVDAFCTPELVEFWAQHTKMFLRIGLDAQAPLKVTDLTRDQDWYWISWQRSEGVTRDQDAHHAPGRLMRNVPLPDGYQARLVKTVLDWAQLHDDWNQLVDAMDSGSGFLLHEYLYNWWCNFGMPYQLFIVVLYRKNTMVGIAPMMVAPKRILGIYRPRLEFIGDQVNTDCPSVIVDERNAEERTLLWRCIASTSSQWDAVYLREQTADKTSHGLAEAIDSRNFSVSSSRPMDAPYVKLTRSWDEYLASRSRALRKGYRRKLRGLEALGDLRFYGYAECTDSQACLQKYLRLESKSWKDKAKMGVSGNPSRTSFYRDLAATLGPIGKLHFRFLSLDGQAIAGTIGLLQNGRFESLEICHDQAFDRYSPGVVITGLELEECCSAPTYDEYNFLVGTYSNKRPWQTHARQVHDLYVLPRTAWGNANRLLIFSLKPRLKQLLKRLRLMEAAERIVYKLEGFFR